LKKGDEKEEELRIALLDLDNLIRKHKENPRIFSDLLALRGIAQYHRGNTEEAIEHMRLWPNSNNPTWPTSNVHNATEKGNNIFVWFRNRKHPCFHVLSF